MNSKLNWPVLVQATLLQLNKARRCFLLIKLKHESQTKIRQMQWFYIIPTILVSASALDNGLARTPPMGWLSWLFNLCEKDCERHPHNCLREELIKRIADRMVADGYKDAGYEYIIVDDCWQDKRDSNGSMVSNKERFPSGMKSLADYVHSKGLKFGMYQDIGTHTCAGEPGLKGHEKQDVATLADWGIDYLKVDGCYEDEHEMPKDYPELGKLLNDSGRPILYSCSWPAYTKNKNYSAIAPHCNIWRNYGDVANSFGSVKQIMNWFGDQPELAEFAGPGHFHDSDMLVVGNSGLNKDEARVQMAVWSILAVPMLMSTDLDTINPDFREILLNKDIIAVSQCKMGKMGKRIYNYHNFQVWKRKYHEGLAIAMLNLDNKARNVKFTNKVLQLDNVDYEVTDFYKEDKPINFKKGGHIKVRINPHGVKFYKFVPKSAVSK